MTPINLDLTSATESQFDPLPAGSYPATIRKTEMKEAGGGGKLPEGTPVLNVGFEIDKDSIPENKEPGHSYGSWVFKRYNMPDAGYDKFDQNMGILLDFLRSTGLWSEEELRSPDGFSLDPEDLHGARVIVSVSLRTYRDNATDEERVTNDVKGVRPMGAATEVV